MPHPPPPDPDPRKRLEAALPGWLRDVPLYRDRLSRLPESERHLPPLELLARLPFVDKHDIRQGFPRNFLGSDADLERLLAQQSVELEHTSGTSQERTPLLLPHGWWPEQENRALRLNPHIAATLDSHPGIRRVTLTSPVCNNDIRYTGRPSRADRTVGDALFVNLTRFPFLWDEPELDRMAREAQDWGPQFLDVDPVYGMLFARFCERTGIRLPTLRFVLASYEYVSVAHRRILERAFGVPVFDLYGSTETGHLLMETAPGIFVPSPDTAWLEVVSPDAEGIGDLVVTTLTNDYMPLIRYRIGDLVTRQSAASPPRYLVHGRSRDAFSTPNGRRITTRHIDTCFADLHGFAHYQLSRPHDNQLLLRFVPDHVPPAPETVRVLTSRLEHLLDAPGRVAVDAVDLLVPEASGKFRLGHP